MLKQTLPFLYKFGLNLTVPFEVVIRRTRGFNQVIIYKISLRFLIFIGFYRFERIIWWTADHKIKKSTLKHKNTLNFSLNQDLKSIKTFVWCIKWTSNHGMNLKISLNHLKKLFLIIKSHLYFCYIIIIWYYTYTGCWFLIKIINVSKKMVDFFFKRINYYFNNYFLIR
jgi:hypothetical protein